MNFLRKVLKMILNKPRVKKLFASALVLTLIFSLAACGGGSSALAGRWVDEEANQTMELLKDGTGIAYGEGLTWKVENNRIYLTAQGQAMSFGYKISGATLILTDDNERSYTYKKSK
jgi:hypothetical protein